MPPKPVLTPEEKKALKNAKKAEKKRKQVEKKKQLKRDQLDREIKYGTVTLRRQEKNWRKMLIDITVPEMRKDLEFAWHNFERVIDCKDFAISLLMDELDKANKQYVLNLKSHSEHIDMLIQMFEERMYELYADFNKQAHDLQQEHEAYREKQLESSAEEENYIKTILHILQIEMKTVKRTRHAEYFSKLEEQDSKQHQLIQTMKGILEQVHLQLWTDTVDFLENFKHKIKERKKMHNELKTEDDRLQKLIKKQLEHIRKSYNIIRSLKVKKAELEKFLGRKFADLQSEFDFFTMAFDLLKAKLDQDRKVDFEKLNCLTTSYNDIITYLEELEVKGRHILHVCGICRKLETLEEKILPFPVNFLTEMSKVSLNDVDGYIEVLDLFWQRVGKADASRYAVNEEREFLITENDILKQRLYQYCQCLKCDNYEPFKVTPGLCRTITEGTYELKKYGKHGMANKFYDEDDDSLGNSVSLLSWNQFNTQT
ncbi:dynein regulatory complex subunit 2-like [Anthonomus grandis grandis]|uniref:dynein regulatory complex subunit 2-like n=1 Tax=Anthonomus grandis grandis TaxID=2921223 RepID=UPI00216681B6|nr:dynein regulatory complex subunit 2-like [Anthonomus grandis grandis]